jgi:hypothetical protein
MKNNTTTNNMANVFGPEFDLSNEEIISIIRKMYNLKVIDTTFNPIEVEVALYNNDYYIRPGIAKERFINELMKLFADSIPQGNKIDDDHRWFRFTILALNIMKNSFDESYFEEQIKRRKQPSTVIVNKDKLRMYLKKLDRNKLESFLEMVIICRCHHGLFITDVSSAGFWEKIHESCREAGVNVPREFDSVEGQMFLNNNKNYYFDVLNTKVIANMLCDAIDLDVEIATSAAKKLHTSGCDAMLDYVHCRTRG